MAVTLIGEVVNSCDATTGFSAGNISGDDDFVEGSGAIGAKISNTYTSFVTTSLGATAPYDFSVGGAEEGYHIIMYFGAKSPLNATAGQRIVVGNGTSEGEWYVPLKSGAEPKVAIFVSRVIDPTRDFDLIQSGSWTTTGNPAQLSNITNMGGGLQTTVSIMGSFNNGQIDQITIGTGVRVDAGTVGTPNTFETVRAQDEDTSKWGWWSSVQGAVLGKGGVYIGPATGTATSVFNDSGFAVIFADELVAQGFYDINMRGSGTDVTWELGNIAAADPAVARWNITVDSTVNSFSDTNGVWTGSDNIVLNTNSTLTGTTVIDGTSLTQNSAVITNCSFLDPNTTAGVAYLTANNIGSITGCNFVGNGTGHAVDLGTINTATTLSWDNSFSGYSGTGNNAPITVNYTDTVNPLEINVVGGNTPTVNNTGAGTVNVISDFTLTLTGIPSGVNVTIVNSSTRAELKFETSTGADILYTHSGGETVDILLIGLDYDPSLSNIFDLPLPSSNSSIPFQLVDDSNYENP